MALSRDPRNPTRWMRGSKRYNDVGGHSPPGDDLENTRDHERIWFELKRTRSCCDCESPGFKYCFETFDWPSYICNGDFPGGDTLWGYWPGNGGIWGLGGWQVVGACGAANLHSEIQNSQATFFPSGSWRDGPYYEKQFFGNNLDLAIGWGNFFPNVDWTFEAWVRPTQQNLDNGDQLIGYGSFAGPDTGGVAVTYLSDGGVAITHKAIGGGTPQESNPGWWEPDQWHHFVLRRDTATKTIAIFINGKLAISRVLPTSGWTMTGAGEFAIDRGSWSDLAAYNSALSPKVIRQHYQAVYGVEGVPNPLTDDQGNIGDPSDVITGTITVDTIYGEGADNVGSIIVSHGDYAAFVTPEDSPFELEARKDQASGYAGLDSTSKVPTARLGTGSASELSFLRGDRAWVAGQVVPKPTALAQMLRADPAPPASFSAAHAAYFGSSSPKFPLSEASAPFTATPASGFGTLGNGTTAPSVSSALPVCFAGESYVVFGGGTQGLVSSGTQFVGAARMQHLLWIRLDALPGSVVNIAKWGTRGGLRLLTDGKVQAWDTSGTLCTTPSPLPLGQWVYVVGAFDGAGAGQGTRIYINGVEVASGGPASFSFDWGALTLAGDGLQAAMAHYSTNTNEYAENEPAYEAGILGIYQFRNPIWTLVDEGDINAGGSGGGGVEASENGVDATGAARSRINFIEGANVALTIADDPGNDEIDVTIAATSPPGAGIEVDKNDADVTAAPRGRLNFVEGANVTLTVTDDGANDEVDITVAAADTKGIEVDKNDVDVTAARRNRLNFIEGTGIALTVADDPGNDEVDITIAATGGGGGGVEVDLNDADVTAAARARLNFIEGAGIDLTISDDAVNGEVDITIAATGGGGGGGGGGLYDAYAYLRDEKPSGTMGGTSTGGAWNTRTLNTEVADADSIVALASNQFTLGAGTYRIRARAPGWRSGGDVRHKLRLRNITDSATALVGSSAYTSSGGSQADAVLEGVFTVVGTKTFELQHFFNNGHANQGLGVEDGIAGTVEVYAEVELWREGSGGGGGGGLYDAYAYIQQQEASGTGGGTSVTATWNKRKITTEVWDTDDVVTIDTVNSRFTLPAGTYLIEARAPANVASTTDAPHKLRLYNATDAAVAAVGAGNYGYGGAETHAFLTARITITSEKTFELQHYTTTGRSATGLGLPISSGATEVYTEIAIFREGSGSGGGGGSYAVDPAVEPPASAHSLDDEFNGSSLDPKWTWDNQGSVTAQVLKGKLLLTAPVGSGTQLRSIRQVAPTGDFTAIARVAVGQRAVDFHMASLFVADSVGGKACGIGLQASNGNLWKGVDNWNSPSSFSARSAQEGRNFEAAWLRIQKVGTDLTFSYSHDGVAWVVQHTATIASFIGAVNRVGLGITNNNGTIVTTAGFDFFRVTEP